MTDGVPGAGVIPVERAELLTRDMERITEFVSGMYVEHRAVARRQPGATPDASVRGAVAGALRAGIIRMSGVEYKADAADTGGRPMGLVALAGSGEATAGRQQHRFAGGEAVLAPPDRPYGVWMRGVSSALLQVPWSAAVQLAEEHTGLPAADLRFTSMRPVSKAAGGVWAKTVMFGCRQLIGSGASVISPLVAEELTRLTAAALLETFPNTAMTVPYVAGAGWTAPSAARRAAAFIEAHADQPVTVAEVAAAAGLTVRTLQDGFRRHYATSPAGYLRRIRLERAHRDLRNAAPGDGVTVAAVARTWGWASPSRFTVAYRQRFGTPPVLTLRA